MDYVLNILITSSVSGKGVVNAELYPIAFTTLDEVDSELKSEGYNKIPDVEHRIKSTYIWQEEDLIKKATIKHTVIAQSVTK